VLPAPAVATNISLRPQAVAADGNGNLYISPDSAAKVVKLDSKGGVTLVAGTGEAGFSGDGGPATTAQIGNSPQGLAVDVAGNLFIADGSRIRKVSPTGIISTVAGGDSSSYSGDGSPAIGAGFLSRAVAVDSAGNIYIADYSFRIRKVTTDGVIRTIAGNGVAGNSGDGGPASQATIGQVNGIAADQSGNLYLATTPSSGVAPAPFASLVRKISGNGTITSVVGNGTTGYGGDGGPATAAQLSSALAVTVDSAGNLYIGDYSRVRKVSVNGTISTVAGLTVSGWSGDGGPATAAAIGGTYGVAVDSDGNLFIADWANCRIRKVTAGIITTVAGNGYLSYSGDGGPAIEAQLNQPGAVALDAAGNLYIADAYNNRIRKVSQNGVIATVAGTGISGAVADGQSAVSAPLGLIFGVAVDANGVLFFSDENHNCVWKVTPDGLIHRFAGTGSSGYGGDGGPALAAAFSEPQGIALDSAGNLYIADVENNRVRKVSASGNVSTVAGTGTSAYSGDGGLATAASLSHPRAVTLDASGNLYIAEGLRVRRISTDGTITTVAGNGKLGSGGDGGLATAAPLYGANGAAVDGSGNLYIADLNDIRLVSSDGAIHTIVSGIVASGLAVGSAGTVYETDASGFVGLVRPAIPFTAANAASNIVGSIAPGEIVTLYGSAMGPNQLVKAAPGSDGLYDGQLAGTSLTVNGIPAPLIYTSATQVAAIVPYGITDSIAQIIATYQGQVSGALSVAVAASAPAIFTADSSGMGQAAAVNQDYSINSAAQPAHVGDVITLFATGEGLTSPAGVDGKPAAQPLPRPVLPVTVTIGGQTAQVQYAGGAPGEVAGVMQVNVTIPSGVQTGSAVPVVLQVGTAISQAGVTLAVQ
jgi:uncharacterized protein (TIGR03437 family)